MRVSFIIPAYNSEKTILSTIESVLAQTDVDIEVICIDDCSKDDTVALLREAAASEPRIKILENETNHGVSYTRNRGLHAATGEYIRFIDADDLIPSDSTEKMLRIAEANDSDMVVGIMEGRRNGRNARFVTTEVIAEKDVIDKYDPAMTRSFSVCNKMFRSGIIREHEVEFRPYKHAEDGLFLYEFLKFASVINGCDSVVYTYCRPSTFRRKSATGSLSEETLRGILEITDRIHSLHTDAPAAFHDALNKRILSATLIEKYYRMLWMLSDDAVKLLMDSIEDYKSRVSDETWAEVIADHPDLMIDKGIFDKKDASCNALFTIAVSDRLNADALNDLLGSLYFQKNPLFRIICGANAEHIECMYRDMQNISFADSRDNRFFYETALSCGTPYIAFIDDPVMFTFETLSRAASALSNDIDYVTGVCRRINNDTLVTPVLYRYCFSREATGIDNSSRVINRLDALISNKVFKTQKIITAMNGANQVIPNSEVLSQLMIGGRYRNIRYILGYNDKELRAAVLSGRDRKSSLIDFLSVTGGNQTAQSEESCIINKVLFVSDKQSLSAPFEKLFNNLQADKEIFSIEDEPDLSSRLARYSGYRTVFFETFDESLDSLSGEEGQRYCILMRFMARGKYADRIAAEFK